MGESVYWNCVENDRRKQKALCVWLHTMLDKVGEIPYVVIAGEALTVFADQESKKSRATESITLLGISIFPGYDDNSICFIWDTTRNELVSFYPGVDRQECDANASASGIESRQYPVPHRIYTGTVEKPMQGRVRYGGTTRAFSQHAISLLPAINALLPELRWDSDYGALLGEGAGSTEGLLAISIPPAIQTYWDELFVLFAKA